MPDEHANYGANVNGLITIGHKGQHEDKCLDSVIWSTNPITLLHNYK